MYKPRDVDELRKDISLALINQGSALNDISEGSILSVLIRAIAGSQQKQELSTQEVLRSFYTSTSTGLDLDRKAGDNTLQRKSGQAASGSVLVISQENNLQIQAGSILTDPVSGIQVRTDSGTTQSVGVNLSVRIPVYAVNSGERGNLKAGTRLISPSFPAGVFTVGSHKTSTGEVCGDMTGGRNVETDSQLRQRVISRSISSRKTTSDSLKSTILQEPSVEWASIESTPGLIQAWVDASYKFTQAELSSYRSTLEFFKPAGVLLSVNQVTRKPVDITIYVKPTKTVDLQNLTDQIVGIVSNYLQELPLEASLKRADLSNLVFSLEGVIEASIVKPTQDFSPGPFSIVRSKSTLVTYDTI